MAKEFYKNVISTDRQIWMYSERGLLSFLFNFILPNDLEVILEKAVNIAGKKIGEFIGFQPTGYTVFTEFSLGKNGFGEPDGGILCKGEEKNAFIIIEGKENTFVKNFSSPKDVAAEMKRLNPNLSSKASYNKEILKKNDYNSKLNGQLELRWRFFNSLKAALNENTNFVSEGLVSLSDEIRKTDRFYMRISIDEKHIKKASYRHVSMMEGLGELYDLLNGNDIFLLLIITSDIDFPREEIEQVRLFDEAGKKIENKNCIFWMSLDRIKDEIGKYVYKIERIMKDD